MCLQTAIAKILEKFNNVVIYNADLEAKNLMNTSKVIKNKLQVQFGKECYENNELNKKHLANIVFQNKKKLQILNSIVHPEVHLHLKNFILAHKAKKYILYENAILFENGSDSFCDKIITVSAPIEIRIARVMQRDKASYEEVLNRINNQWEENKKTLQSHYVIPNLKIEDTKEKALIIHNILTKIRE